MTLVIAAGRSFEIEWDDARQKALEKIKSLKLEPPADWTFDRDKANAR